MSIKFADRDGKEITVEDIGASIETLERHLRPAHWAYETWQLGLLCLATDGEGIYLLDKCGNWRVAEGISLAPMWQIY